MNDMLMLMLILDDNMEEGYEANDSLSGLVALQYGKHPNALLEP